MSPFYVQSFCFMFFFVCLVIILCWRRNTIESREKKQATVKLVISTATITRESNIISTWRISEVWLKVYIFSLLVISSYHLMSFIDFTRSLLLTLVI